MIVITIGTEEKMLNQTGRVYARQRLYAGQYKKYECFVFTKNKEAKKIVDGNFQVVPVYGSTKLAQVVKLFKLIPNELPENATQQTVSSQDPFEIGLISYLISKRLKSRFLVQMHTDSSSPYFRKESIRNYFQYLISIYIFKRADRIRVVSKRMQDYLVKDLKIDIYKISLQPILPEPSQFTFEPDHEKKTDFLVMSRIEKVKNISLAIRAVERLNQKLNKTFSLKIVGSGSQKKDLQKQFSDEKYNFVIWNDWTNSPENEYKEAKFLLITSWYEGFAMTAVESTMCGTPVIMTDVGCADYCIFEGVNGSISRTFEVSNFSSIIERALNHKYDFKK